MAETAQVPTTPQAAPRRSKAPGLRLVRVPGFRTIEADDALRERVDRAFAVPMTLLSVGFLGMIAFEIWGPQQGTAAALLDAGFVLVWVAFAAELAVKTAIAESRFGHLKRNWIDLVVLLLPFLRPLRFASQIARTAQGLRLRGAGTKLARNSLPYVVGLPVATRVARRLGLSQAQSAKPPEEMTRDELIEEVKRLRASAPPSDVAG